MAFRSYCVALGCAGSHHAGRVATRARGRFFVSACHQQNYSLVSLAEPPLSAQLFDNRRTMGLAEWWLRQAGRTAGDEVEQDVHVGREGIRRLPRVSAA
jgi:hypothetical protein